MKPQRRDAGDRKSEQHTNPQPKPLPIQNAVGFAQANPRLREISLNIIQVSTSVRLNEFGPVILDSVSLDPVFGRCR